MCLVLETAVSKADLGEFDITHWSETTDVGSNLFFILKSRDTNTEAIAYVKHPGPLQIILDYVPLVSSPPAPSECVL